MTTPPSLVIVRCKQCRTRLGSLDTMPDDWSGMLTVHSCPNCVVPENRRIVEVLGKQRAVGIPMLLNIPLTDLRRHAMKAKRLGRPEGVDVIPVADRRISE
ncbi:MAG: hypothetical protein P4L86_33050 [Mycobacterium sp.]|nr:hypothetical protein [Mycobacterium sp.]